MLSGADPETVFTGARHAPHPLTEAESRSRRLTDAPLAVRLDLPDWLVPSFDAYPDEVPLAFRDRAPLDLRVNLLKSDRAQAIVALFSDGVSAEPLALSDTALRVIDGARKVAQSAAYKDGLVEIQDAASQAVIDLIEPRPGETVLDLCAGAGGKTLAIAARMNGSGRFLAHDISPARMVELEPRADRAGVDVDHVATSALDDVKGTIDLVMVDAPCSGSGAWRRNPDAKWRLTQDDLDRLQAVQEALIDQAVDLCGPEGRIAYMTCSLLATENGDQIVGAQRRHPDWGATHMRQITPLDGGDGFFCALLARL